MRPWTIDADDIQIASDFDPQLLHRTPLIEEFLEPDFAFFSAQVSKL